MAKNRFAPRGPSRLVVITGGAVIALVIAGCIYLATAKPVSPRGESYSSESGVLSSVFVPSARWNQTSSAIELSAIVTARVDASATCTLTATKGSQVRETNVQALPDASTMTCANMSLPVAGEDQGRWNVIVRYTAQDFTAESKPMFVKVGA